MKNIEGGPQAPRNLLEELQAEKPDRNVVFTAIEQLEGNAQKREFFSAVC